MVAGSDSPNLLARPAAAASERYRAVTAVLVWVLFLNLAVAVAKLVLGYMTGAVSIVSDGLHSLTDSFSNVAALIGVRVARKPPDKDHPYGHRKFETLSAAAIAAFLLVVMIEVGRAAWQRFTHGGGPEVPGGSFAVMLATIAVNIVVATYERRAGQRLSSEVLLADSMHTRSDVATSITVILALVGTRLGYPLLDPMAALVVVGFIGHAAWEIVEVHDRRARRSHRHPGRRSARGGDDGATSHGLPRNPHARIRRLRVPRPAHLDGGGDAARRGARDLARGEGPPDDALPADRRRDHPPRAATEAGDPGA